MAKTKYVAVVIVAGAALLSVVLNPSPDRHRAKIKDAIAQRSQLERAFGVGQLIAFASKYHSLGVASYTTFDDKVTSIGVLGLVFVAE